MDKEKILQIMDETYKQNKTTNNADMNLKLLQTTQEFARTFDYELPIAHGVKGKIVRFIKRGIRKSTRFITKPYAEQMLKFEENACELLGMYIDKFNEVDKYNANEKIEDLDKAVEMISENAKKTEKGCTEKCREQSELLVELKQKEDEIAEMRQTVFDHEEAIFKLTKAFNDNVNLVLELSNSTAQINQYLFNEKDSTFRAYAQAGEDSIISFILGTLGEKIQGYSYLDIGCNRYKELSNTYHFYEQGMRGVLIDANPKFVDEVKSKRPGDTVLNIGVGEKNNEKLTFYVSNWDWLSSFNKETIVSAMKESPWVKIEQEIEVPVLTLNEIFEKYFYKVPAIVSIDVEGDELPILKSVDMEYYRPLIYVVETIEYREKIDLSNKRMDIIDFMQSKDYKEYAFTGVNSIFLDKRQFSKRGV